MRYRNYDYGDHDKRCNCMACEWEEEVDAMNEGDTNATIKTNKEREDTCQF